VIVYAVACVCWVGAIAALGLSAAGFLESTGLLLTSTVLSGLAILAAATSVLLAKRP
jgi:hypothetical protein